MQPEEFNEFEDRVYLSPTLSRDEQLQFVDTLREIQKNNTNEIISDTYALGTQVPSRLGGLSGAEDTFIAKYQTPQTNQTVSQLRAAAQQSALNTALSNLQNAWKKRYQSSLLNKGGGGGGGNDKDLSPDIKTPDHVDLNDYVESSGPGATIRLPDGRLGVFEVLDDGRIGRLLYIVGEGPVGASSGVGATKPNGGGGW